MENNRNDKERNERSSWENESQHMGSQNKSYGYNEEESNEQQNMSGRDAGTGSSMQNQGMGSRGNEMNDPTSGNNPEGWGSDSNRMSGRSDSSENSTWDSTGGDSYSTRQENSGRSIGEESGEESTRMSGRNNESDQWETEGGHNMSSGSAYLEEETDRASRDMSGSRDHDYMENNGNSTSDYNLTSDLNDDWDESRSQNLSGRDTDFDGGSHSQEMRSDSDDFHSSDFEENDKPVTDMRSSDAKTFNEDEESWRNKKDMSGYEDDFDNETRHTGNRGTGNNNWDATDQTQRGREWHGDDEEKNSLF